MTHLYSPQRLDEIRRLDPRQDHQRITYLIACYEFPWDMTRSLELALFRTFCVPSISRLLVKTGEFQQRAQKRYDDTDIMVSEMIEWGYDSPRGQAAIRKMNQLHGRFEIANDDYLYVLSTFIFVPIRWIHRYGWRELCLQEQLGLFYFWRQVGRRMGIRDIPEDAREYERWSDEFEKTHFRFDRANHRVATSVLKMFTGWFPRPLRGLAHAGMRAVMDPAMLDGFGLDAAPRAVDRLVHSAMRLRAVALRYGPKRRKPRLRTQGQHRSYPNGYTIDRLGPDLPPDTDLDDSRSV